MLVFNRQITDAERKRVEGSIMGKYALWSSFLQIVRPSGSAYAQMRWQELFLWDAFGRNVLSADVGGALVSPPSSPVAGRSIDGYATNPWQNSSSASTGTFYDPTDTVLFSFPPADVRKLVLVASRETCNGVSGDCAAVVQGLQFKLLASDGATQIGATKTLPANTKTVWVVNFTSSGYFTSYLPSSAAASNDATLVRYVRIVSNAGSTAPINLR